MNTEYIQKIKKYQYKKRQYLEEREREKDLANRFNLRSENGEVCHWRRSEAGAML